MAVHSEHPSVVEMGAVTAGERVDVAAAEKETCSVSEMAGK
jgi:hypothetical protein